MKSSLITAALSFVICSSVYSGAQAQTGTVEKVKGTKAVVNFDGKTPRIGDTVSAEGASSSMGSSSGLRKREQGITYGLTIGSLSSEATAGTTTVKQSVSTTTLAFSYLRNFGSFEIGGGLEKENTDADNDQTEVSVIGQYNFTVNKPRNDMIPYARADFHLLSGKTSGFSVSGTGIGLGGGLLYFPFSQIFAVDLGLAYIIDNYEVGSATKTKYKNTTTAITAGWRMYF